MSFFARYAEADENTPTPPTHPLLRPLFYIIRPGNVIVPMIALDEMPVWLEVVGTYVVDLERSRPVSVTPIPRMGEYDIICRYCVHATEYVHGPGGFKPTEEQQSVHALQIRQYAPTTARYKQDTSQAPANLPAPETTLLQPQPIRPVQTMLLPSCSTPSFQSTLPAVDQNGYNQQQHNPNPSPVPPPLLPYQIPPQALQLQRQYSSQMHQQMYQQWYYQQWYQHVYQRMYPHIPAQRDRRGGRQPWWEREAFGNKPIPPKVTFPYFQRPPAPSSGRHYQPISPPNRRQRMQSRIERAREKDLDVAVGPFVPSSSSEESTTNEKAELQD